jgi:hypothetical protein
MGEQQYIKYKNLNTLKNYRTVNKKQWSDFFLDRIGEVEE